MRELNQIQMEEIEGVGFWGCLSVGLFAIGAGLSLTNPISAGAFFALYGGTAALAVEACGSW